MFLLGGTDGRTLQPCQVTHGSQQTPTLYRSRWLLVHSLTFKSTWSRAAFGEGAHSDEIKQFATQKHEKRKEFFVTAGTVKKC